MIRITGWRGFDFSILMIHRRPDLGMGRASAAAGIDRAEWIERVEGIDQVECFDPVVRLRARPAGSMSSPALRRRGRGPRWLGGPSGAPRGCEAGPGGNTTI